MSTGSGSIDDAATVAVTSAGSVTGSPLDAAIGSRGVVGRYKIRARIGAGGMATVWSAHDEELDRTVAVKLVRAPRRDADVRARMLREAQAMAALSHPHVVQVYDVGVAGDDVWIAMELVSGRTLTQWLGETQRAWPDVVAAFCDLGRGLQAVHDAGLVHRDFKPHNAMIDDMGRVRLIDFGLVRDEGAASLRSHDELDDGRSSRDDTLTATGVVMGTPAYMSPEQVEGGTASAASDQFSFCVALFEALHGVRPFVGSDRKALMQAIVHARIAAGERRPIPGWLEAAVRRGLSRDPGLRWPNLGALVDHLQTRAAGRRRRGLVLGLGVLVTGASIFALTSRVQESCRDTTLAAAWNDATAERIDTALRATELRYADDAATSVRTDLDAFAREWTSAWDEACTAELDPATRDARLACLSRGRRDLEESLEILVAADAQVAEVATRLVQGLSDPHACAEAADATFDVPLELQADVAALREDLARAEALHRARRLDEARELTAEILERARALDVPGFAAEAGFAHARVLVTIRSYDDAIATFEAAYHLALAHRKDALAARIATMLVDACVEVNRLDDAEQWVRHAHAEIERLGRPPLLLAQLDDDESQLRQRQGKYEEGVALLRDALALLEAQPDVDVTRLAQTLDHYGNALENVGRLNDALDAHTRALALLEEAHGPHHPSVGRASSNLANSIATLGRHEEARTQYSRAIEILTAAYGSNHRDVGASLQGRGVTEMNLGRFDEARADLLQAHAIDAVDSGAESPDAGIPLNNLGTVELRAGNVDAAEGYFRRAHAIYQTQLGEDHPWTALALANLARIDSMRGDNAAAIAKYDDVLAAFGASVGEDHLYYAMALNNRASTILDEGRTDPELGEHFAKAHAILVKAFSDSDPRTGQPLLGLARFEVARNQLERARPHLQRLSTLWSDGKATERRDEGVMHLLSARVSKADPTARADARAAARRARDIFATLPDSHEDLAQAEAILRALDRG